MNIQPGNRTYKQRKNPVTQQILSQAGVSGPQIEARVDWIVDKYQIEKPEDYLPTVRAHNRRGNMLAGGFALGVTALAVCATGYLSGMMGSWALAGVGAGAAVAGYTGRALERNHEHKSFGALPFGR